MAYRRQSASPSEFLGTLVAAELLAANAGLGYMISMGRQFARPDIIILE
jgi:ABC-type nitrate/sulfonate/bicarbonate transport system permease component